MAFNATKRFTDKEVRNSLVTLFRHSPLHTPVTPVRRESPAETPEPPPAPVVPEKKPLTKDEAEREARRNNPVQPPNNKEIKGFLKPPPSLLFFKTLDNFLIRRNDDLEMDAIYDAGIKYEIYNVTPDYETRVLIAAQHKPAEHKCCKKFYGFPFIVSMMNHEGVELFALEGESANRCGNTSVQVQDDTIRYGEIIRTNRGSTIYIEVHDSSGEPIFEIRTVKPVTPRPYTGGDEYLISSMFGEILVGKITPRWDKARKAIAEGIYGLRFTKALPVELKAVLLSASIIIDYKFFDKY